MSEIAARLTLAGEVRALLARRRIAQQEVADHLGISQSSMSRRLSGAQPFTTDEIYRLADLFSIDAGGLLNAGRASA
ncbi:hypothetical protein BH11ACT6_BH11ACT6_34480 [soil metagenome]